MELRTYVEILWRRKSIVIIVVLTAALVLVIGLSQLSPTYTAATKIRLATAVIGSVDYFDFDILYTDRLMNTAIELVSSDSWLLDVQQELRLAVPPLVQAEIIPNSELLQITVSDHNPQQAVTIANILAEKLVNHSETLFTEIRTDLGAVSSLTILEPASLPEQPDGSSKLTLLVAGLFISTVAGGVLALVIENLDTRLYTIEQVQMLTSMPIVTEIPYIGRLSKQDISNPPNAIKQVFRRLSVMLYPLASHEYENEANQHNNHHQSLLVISAMPQEGRSTVVAHLAVAAARSGRSVVVVDADLQHPTMYKLFDVPNQKGLTSLLNNEATLDTVLHKSSVAEGVHVLPSGPIRVDSSDLLDTGAIHALIEELTTHFDLVLIDSPAFLNYADSAVLISSVDDVLVLGRLGHTRREQLIRVCDYLEQVSVQTKGLVLNCVPDSAHRSRNQPTQTSEHSSPPRNKHDDNKAHELGRRKPTANQRERVVSFSNIPLNNVLFPIVTGILIGLICLFLPLPLLFAALVGGIGLYTVLKRPELGVLGILLAASTLFTREVFPSVGFASISVLDVAFFALGFLILIRWLVEPKFRFISTPLDMALLALLLAALVSTIQPILTSSLQMWEIYQEVIIIFYYMIFFLITQLVREKHQLKLLVEGFFLLAAATGAIMLVQYLAGDSVKLLMGRVETTITQGIRYEGVIRILPPGQSLVLIGNVLFTTLLIVERIRLRWVLYWVLTAIGVILTFNRGFWVGLLMAFSLLLFLLKGSQMERLIQVGFVAFVVAILTLIIAVLQPESKIASLVMASTQRLATVVTQDITADSSFQWRYPEYRYAVARVLENPLSGVGMGNRYRPLDMRLDSEHFDGRRYMHNGHLYFLVKSGLLGYMCLIWVSVLFVGRGLLLWHKIADPIQQSIVLGMVIAYISVLISAIAEPIFMEFFWAPVLGTMMGTNEVIYRLNTGVRYA